MINIWGECFRILKKKKKSFWLSHLNECPELLCGLSCDHRWSQTIPLRNSPWEKRILQELCDLLVDLVLWDGVKYLSLSIDIVPQWILWKKSREDWSLRVSRVGHCSSSSISPTLLDVAPPPAGPAGCRPLYLLHLLNLSFTIRAPNGGCILHFRVYQSFACNLLSTPRCESQVPSKET